MSPLDVTIVGAGSVGQALGTNLMRVGHRVRYAVRGAVPDTLPPGATTVPIDAVAADADLVVLAVPFPAVTAVVSRLGLGHGAVLVDATNPFGEPLPPGFISGAAVVAAASGADVHVVKAFNVLGAEHMVNPPLPERHRPLLPVAGDDPRARDLVVGLARQLGFDALAVGDLSAAGILEEAARYWGLLAFAGRRGRGVVLVAHQRPGV